MLLVPALAGTATSQVGPVLEPTSAGQAIVGFNKGLLPDVDVGDHLVGYEVLRIVAPGSFVAVAAESLTRLRLDMQGYPGVSYIEDDALRFPTATPNDPRYSSQWGPGHMGFPAAWDTVGYGSSSITVAVLDTGILRTHEDFDSRVLQGWDYVNNDNSPDDDCDHGTHVAGTVGATTNNGLGVAGMSQATILPMKVLAQSVWGCSGSDSGIADAIYDSTDQGARIISMSLGSASGSTTIHNAVQYATNNGVIVVAAAGNDGSSNSVDYPGAFDEVIAVAALASSGSAASYSDRGPQVEISAPGSDIWSTWGNVGYNSIDGTSMATPHVSGALALALSCDSSLSGSQLRTLMQNNAQDLGTAGRDNTYGFGLLRIDTLINAIGTCGGTGNSPPTASFTYTTSGLTANVDGSGSSDPNGDALTYAWDFGDGATGTGATTSHMYAADGTYTITLTADDGNGGSDSSSQSVTVSASGGDPVLTSGVAQSGSLSGAGDEDFYRIEVPAGATQLQVVLDGPAGSDFDLYTRQGSRPTDSTYSCRPYTSSSDETCTHVNPAAAWWYIRVDSYSGSGTYTVTATVTSPAPNQPPTASFTASCTELTCSFDGTASSDPDGDALTYAWDFGDGATGSGATASHTYASGGTYTATLTVDDGNGGSDSSSQNVAPTDPPAGDPYLDSGVPQSGSLSGTGDEDFYRISVPAGASQLEVVLDGPAGSDFDLYTRQGARPSDSTYSCRPYTSSSDETCTHSNPAAGDWYIRVDSYSGSGSYTLTATVTTGGGNGAPTASFTYSCSSLTCDFDASGSSDPDGDALSYSWNFGDGATASGVAPTHAYASGGTYTVSLTVDDGNGGTDSTSASVTVSSDPDPSTPNLANGQTETVYLSGSGAEKHYKIWVPAGAGSLTVVMDGPACSFWSCPLDADLYVRYGARATDASYDCRPYESDSDETCTISNPAEGWWYVRLDSYSGSGNLDVTASY